MECCCEEGTERDSIKFGDILDKLRDCEVLQQDSAVCS